MDGGAYNMPQADTLGDDKFTSLIQNNAKIVVDGGPLQRMSKMRYCSDGIACYTGKWPASYEQFAGPWMLIWDRYKVVSETQSNGDVWYSVVPE